MRPLFQMSFPCFSASEIQEKTNEELYRAFLTKIQQVGYHELYHMGYTGKEE